MFVRSVLSVLIFALSLVLSTAHAGELGTIEASNSRATLISEVQSAPRDRGFWITLKLDPIPEWHTYWENPGDSGAAPIVDWTVPEGVTIGDPLFGVPHGLPAGPLMNYGYDSISYLLYRIELGEGFKGSTVTIAAEAEWLVCKVECIPQFGAFEAQLPVGDGALDSSVAADFTEARAALPDPEIWSADLSFTADVSTLLVHMTPEEAEAVTTAHFYPLAEGVTEYAAAQTLQVVPEGLAISLPRYGGAPSPENGEGILDLGYSDGSRQAVNVNAEIAEPAAVPAPTSGPATTRIAPPDVPIWQAAIFAFVGGIILNLMPCVFPVLSLKAFSIVRSGGANQAETRREGIAYTLGIVASFAVIVAFLVGLRSGGEAIGWGFQLQEPLFVAAMALIMVLVGMSLAGVFEISIGAEGAGQSLASSGGTKGAFFTGVLATLVATPCTAPLMAPAIGFALAQPVHIIALVFLMLALGLAFPFLLLSFSPAIARMMPRPGAWMETLKQGLAFPMFATAVWLLSVFATQAGPANMILLLAALVIISFGVWLTSKGGRITKGVGGAIALVTIVMFAQQPLTSDPAKAPEGIQTAEWSREVVSDLRGEGRPVFAYFTADWCITCKVNERVALFRDETMNLFQEEGVTLVKGDWTNKNEAIANLLAEYGRAGVPLYIYFPPGGEPVLLPEILTPGVIRDAIVS